MKITATLPNVTNVAPGIWHASSAVDQIINDTTQERPDSPSVLLIGEGAISASDGSLSFDFGAAELLVLGDRSRGTIILEQREPENLKGASAVQMGGDDEFLHVVAKMAPHIREAGPDLLERIRELDPEGHFDRHGRRFINRPDNFVALEPQTRISEIIVHVRGLVSVDLPAVSTQRGYSAFKVRKLDDLMEAGRALGLARRRF